MVLIIGLMYISSVGATDLNNESAMVSDVCDEIEINNVNVTMHENPEIYGQNDNDSSHIDESLVGESCDSENLTSGNDSTYHYGYWVFSTGILDMNLTDLSNHGVSDILLNSYVFVNNQTKNDVEDFIFNATEKGIRTHIWVQVFYDGSWVRPISREGVVNYEFFNKKIEELKKIANTTGIYGIHYDYLRFSGSESSNATGYQNPGGKEAIVYFVNESIKAIHEINPSLIVSAAIMPEPENLERVYGVDYPKISELLDAIMPMIYTGNYNQDTDWVKNTTKWFVENSKRAEIWTGLQGYSFADYDEEVLSNAPTSQMNIDIKAALDANATGAIVFRYGVCNNLDFTNLSVDEEELRSFSYLNYLVSNAKKPIILSKDITFNEKYDENFTKGILIMKNNLVIDGGNHVVDARGMARIFNITGRNNTLMNFKFINAFGKEGAALFITGNDTKIINCTFIDGNATLEAGAIFLTSPRGQIINSTFINCSSYYTGAVLVNSINASVTGCYFEGNRANVSAGALGWAPKDNGIIKDCVFINNGAYNEGGGAIFWNKGKNGLIENSTFANNHANFNGSAIFWSFGDNGKISDCTFTNNSATLSGGAIYLKGKDNVVYNSTFANNSAQLSAAIDTLNDLDVLKCTLINNDLYAKSGAIVNVVSNPENTKIVAKATSYVINYGGKYSITLKDSAGNLIKCKNVTFNLAGKKIGAAVTNVQGIATIKLSAKTLKALKAGKKNLFVKFSANNYASANNTVKITLNKEKTKLTAGVKKFKSTLKTKKYTLTLINSKSKAMKKAKVTLKVKGKTYKATTNSNGKATFKITKLTNKGTFKAKIKYAGNNYYKSAFKTVKIKIK